MIRALVWKEYREHRGIWLTLAVVGGVGLFGLSKLMAPEGLLSRSGARESLQTVAVLLAWTYGLVCGAMLLANENEAGTMIFLDILPVRRLQLWLVKFLFGLLLLLTHVAVLAGFVVSLGIVETAGELLATLTAMGTFGLIALSWSLLFSAWGDNVLNVIGLSFLGQIVGVFMMALVLVPVAVVLTALRPDKETSKLFLVGLGVLGLTVGPVFGSARLFTRLDRDRRVRLVAGCGHGTAPSQSQWEWASWGRLLWLSYVQMRRLFLGLTIFSLLLGFLLPLFGPAAWPLLTLLLGILCGVTVWSDEQMSVSFRFLGDQRFPLGRVWIVKVGMRFALAVLAAFLLLLPSLVLAGIHYFDAQAQAEMLFATPKHVPFWADLFHSSLIGPIVPVGTHLSLWLLYGFAAGHLCSLLFRKSLVAAVVALGSAGMLVCLWVPSLVGLGLHFWQVAGVPLALLVAGWLLMPAWTADRLLARGTFVRLGTMLFAAGLWTAGALWYRVAEVPDVPDAFDLSAFAASIPSMDQNKNKAGMEMHAAWHEVEQMANELFHNNTQPRKPLFPNDARSNTFAAEIGAVYADGWPNHPSDLGDKLDAQFQKEWYRHVKSAADAPVGVVEDAKLLTINSRMGRWDLLPSLNQVLMVRGLQMQARGQHDVFVEHLRIGLALSRNVQNHAPPPFIRIGREAELVCINALDRWLERLTSHAELLERVRDILLQHMAQLPSAIDVLMTAYLIARNTLEQTPEAFVEGEVREIKGREHVAPTLQKAETDLVSLLWRIPWEHERHQRLLRVVFEVDSRHDPQRRVQAAKWGGSYMNSLDLPVRVVWLREKRATASLHAALLKVAVRLYQAKNNKLPRSLEELTLHKAAHLRQGNYLPVVPLDPFDNRPFRYRVQRSKAGGFEAVLWVVGEDGHDDGGKRSAQAPQLPTSVGEDLVYRVPPPPH
jgi:hypothetical protein